MAPTRPPPPGAASAWIFIGPLACCGVRGLLAATGVVEAGVEVVDPRPVVVQPAEHVSADTGILPICGNTNRVRFDLQSWACQKNVHGTHWLWLRQRVAPAVLPWTASCLLHSTRAGGSELRAAPVVRPRGVRRTAASQGQRPANGARTTWSGFPQRIRSCSAGMETTMASFRQRAQLGCGREGNARWKDRMDSARSQGPPRRTEVTVPGNRRRQRATHSGGAGSNSTRAGSHRPIRLDEKLLQSTRPPSLPVLQSTRPPSLSATPRCRCAVITHGVWRHVGSGVDVRVHGRQHD